MNWTGGTLQRTKQANKGVLQQQRAYFAKLRTHLQDATDPSIAPFYPSYLRDNNEACLVGIPWFGPASIRHSVKRPRKKPHQAQQDLRSPKRNTTEMTTEVRLFEAHKRRLLRRPDWIGVAPSKPVSLQFLSSNEKEKIGKRRRTTRKMNAAPRQPINIESKREHLSLQYGVFDRTDQDPATRNHPQDIRIRIGTDALTDTFHTQPNMCAQSHASSKSMLLEQNGLNAQKVTTRPVLEPLVDAQRHATTSACEQDDALGHAYKTGQGAQHYQNASHHAEHTLNLVYGGLDSPAGSRSHNVPDSHEIGETQLLQTPDFAHAAQTDHVHHATIHGKGPDACVIDHEHHATIHGKGPDACVIDHEEPRTKYLAISDASSSPSDTAVYTRNSVLHNHPTTNNSGGAAKNWSQHATEGQGNQCHFGRSSISASLPSLRCGGVGTCMSAHGSGIKVIRPNRWKPTNVRALDQEEKNWQAFVLGSDNASSLQATHKHARPTSPLTSKYSKQASSSRYLPLSVAVSSVSPRLAS